MKDDWLYVGLPAPDGLQPAIRPYRPPAQPVERLPTLAELYAQAQPRAYAPPPAPVAPAPAAQPPEQPGLLSDVGNLLKSGYANTAAGVNWLAGKTPGLNQLIDARGGEDYWNQVARNAHGGLSDLQQQAGQKRFIDADGALGPAWSDPRALFGTVAESIPGTVMGMAVGGPATAGLRQLGLKALPSLGAAGSQRLTLAAGAAGYGAGEGLVSAGSGAVQARKTVLRMPHDKLLNVSPQYRDLLNTLAPDQAREALAASTADQVGLESGLTVAATGAPMGAAFGKLFHGAGKLASSRLGSAGLGLAGEAGQEFVQSGAEQYLQNRALQQNVNPDQALWDGVLNQAVSGALAGAAMGGAMAGAGHRNRVAPVAADPTAEAAIPKAVQAVDAPTAPDVAPAAPNVQATRLAQGWTAFPPDTGTLGIPRADMPQIKAEDRGALVNFLKARGIAHTAEDISAADLKPTQAEFSAEKVAQSASRKGSNRSILISGDGHIVDGHHQWLAALAKGESIRAIRLDAPIATLLEAAKAFPSAKTAQESAEGAPPSAVETPAAPAPARTPAETARPSPLNLDRATVGDANAAEAPPAPPATAPEPPSARSIQLQRGQSIELSPVLGNASARPAVTAEERARLDDKLGPRPAKPTAGTPDQPAPSPDALAQQPQPEIVDDQRRQEGQAQASPLLNLPHQLGNLRTQEIPVNDLRLSEDVPQFKAGADAKTGVVEPLGGKYERVGTAPIVVWEQADGRKEVISGRHRLDLARRSGEQTIPAQIVRERDGIGAQQAAILDAELNIRDGQGKGKDYVQYFQHAQLSPDEAKLRGLISRPLGQRAYAIANDGAPDTVAAHRADRLSDDAAYRISAAAPGNARLQALGVKAVSDGKSAAHAANLMQAVSVVSGGKQDGGDLFGFDSSALQDAERMATLAGREQRRISERLAAVQGAAKRPELARQEGVNIQDPAALRAKLQELQQSRTAWEQWATNPALIESLRASMAEPAAATGTPAKAARQSVPSPKPVTLSATAARAQLVAALGEKYIAALERSGRLRIHQNDPTKTGAAGFVDPRGVIHLVAPNLDKGDALSVALHEAMHVAKDARFLEGDRAKLRLAHAVLRVGGVKNLIGNPSFSGIVQHAYRLAGEGDPVALAALQKARSEAPDNVPEELAAYLVQYAPQDMPLVRRIIAAIRAALYRIGVSVQLTPADVRALAVSAIKAQARDIGKASKPPVARAAAYSLPDFAPTEADKAEVERQIKAVKESRDAQGRLLAPNGAPSNLNERQWKQVRTPLFKAWFGDWESSANKSSKIVDANGEPLVVYHGTEADITAFDRSKSQKGPSKLGFWMTDQPDFAENFGSVAMPAFILLKNPKTLSPTAWDAMRMAHGGDAAYFSALRDQYLNAGFDGLAVFSSKERVGRFEVDVPSVFAAFEPAQIKSAIGNAGTFSARSPRIDYSQPATQDDADEQARLWEEFQKVRAQFQEKQPVASAFRRWFGQGIEGITAKNGAPLTLYHGTNAAFYSFDPTKAGTNSRNVTSGLGFFMTADKGLAAHYGSRVLELHARLSKPYFFTDADLSGIETLADANRLRRKLVERGYDGGVITAPGAAPYVVAFESKQVKLASNDAPTDSPDFRYSRPAHPGRPNNPSPPAAAATPPAETQAQAFQRQIQDKLVRFEVVQKWLKDSGIDLSPQADVHGAAALLPKKTAAKLETAREQVLKPLVERAAAGKWAIGGGQLIDAIAENRPLPARFKPSISEYLHAAHAKERNAAIAKINPKFPDGGSGLLNAQADDILARYRTIANAAAFVRLARDFQAITQTTQKTLLDAGVVSQETVKAWNGAYRAYVPLKGGPEDGAQRSGTGAGFSVNGKQKRALGHTLRDENIVENIWRDHERATYLAEKQVVARSIQALLKEAANPEIGTVGQPEKRAALVQGWYHQVWIGGAALGAFQSYSDAKAAIAQDSLNTGRPLSKYGIRHQMADPSVIYTGKPMLADNEIGLYENGQLIRLQLNDELLARAGRNLGADAVGGLLQMGQQFNRFLSSMYTGYNPEFLLTNIARDFTAGFINLTGNYGVKLAGQAIARYPSAVAALWRHIRTGQDPLIERYRAAGGSTGAAYLSDLERIGTDITRVFQDFQGARETWASGDKAGAVRVAVADKLRLVGRHIENMNKIGENALRVATFKALLDARKPEAEAARAAGEVTVNFNRKGELASQLGGLYLFFNPSVQGTKAIWNALSKGEHRGQAIALSGALVGLAVVMAELARSGSDDDERRWRKIPGHTKDRNLIVPLPDGKEFMLPMPYGYGAFWSLGNVLSDLRHGEDGSKAGIRLASTLFEHFGPFGNPFAGDEADLRNIVSLLPTALKPPVALAMNRSELGRPLMPETQPWNAERPDSQRMWRATQGTIYERIATGINRLTGGSKYEAGAVDVSPESMRYLWRTLTGGVGQFAADTANLAAVLAQGAGGETQPKEWPILRRFVRADSIQDARSLFHEQAAKVREAESVFAAAKRDRDMTAMRDIRAERRSLLALGRFLDAANRQIRARRQLQDAIERADLPLAAKRLQLATVEKQEEAIYGRFYDLFMRASRAPVRASKATATNGG